jgi:hypothetical protein
MNEELGLFEFLKTLYIITSCLSFMMCLVILSGEGYFTLDMRNIKREIKWRYRKIKHSKSPMELLKELSISIFIIYLTHPFLIFVFVTTSLINLFALIVMTPIFIIKERSIDDNEQSTVVDDYERDILNIKYNESVEWWRITQ